MYLVSNNMITAVFSLTDPQRTHNKKAVDTNGIYCLYNNTISTIENAYKTHVTLQADARLVFCSCVRASFTTTNPSLWNSLAALFTSPGSTTYSVWIAKESVSCNHTSWYFCFTGWTRLIATYSASHFCSNEVKFRINHLK